MRRVCTGVFAAPLNELFVEYTNQYCVPAPSGFTVPFSVAVADVIAVAG